MSADDVTTGEQGYARTPPCYSHRRHAANKLMVAHPARRNGYPRVSAPPRWARYVPPPCPLDDTGPGRPEILRPSRPPPAAVIRDHHRPAPGNAKTAQKKHDYPHNPTVTVLRPPHRVRIDGFGKHQDRATTNQTAAGAALMGVGTPSCCRTTDPARRRNQRPSFTAGTRRQQEISQRSPPGSRRNPRAARARAARQPYHLLRTVNRDAAISQP